MDERRQTLTNLTSRLLDEEANLSLTEKFDSALMTSIRKSHECYNRKYVRRNVMCYNCRKYGHFARECRNREDDRNTRFGIMMVKNLHLLPVIMNMTVLINGT